MKKLNRRWFFLTLTALFLIACQPPPPGVVDTTEAPPVMTTYRDGHGFFTVDYPEEWIALGELFEDAPFPHVAIASHREIMDLSQAEQPLPADQIGVALMLIPQTMFADAGLTSDTPLVDALPALLLAMSDDEEQMSRLIGGLQAEPATLADGTDAVRLEMDAATEAYAITLAEPADGLYLFASRIQALDHHNSELEAQIDAIADSFRLTGTTEEIMGSIMARMGAADDGASTASDEPVQIESGGEVPFYTRFGADETFDDGETVAIIFYRPPDCIAADFNLLGFFHFPGENDPGAFACGPPTVTAIETWANGPESDPAPLASEMTGRGAVPVWFVSLSDVDDAAADGVVTIAELAGLPSRQVGTASTYSEFLRPTQSNDAPMIQFHARGTLESGEPFLLDVSKGAPEVEDHVSIMIGDGAPTVTFTATEYAYEGPSSVPGGLTRIELVNAGEQEHGLWLVKLEDDRTFDDFMGVMATMESDPQIPEWLLFYGGVTASAGKTVAYIVDLAPGAYTLFSFSSGEDGEPDIAKGMVASLRVTDVTSNSAVPPSADLRAELVDFSFVLDGEPGAGRQIVEVTNSGMEPHEMILLELGEGTTVQDAMDFMMAGPEAEGPPPFVFVGGAAPMAAGLTAWYEIELAAGDYGLICLVPSPANEGAPHFMLGMVKQISVNATSLSREVELEKLGQRMSVPANWHTLTCDDGGVAFAENAADLDSWCHGGDLDPSGLLFGVDVRSLDFMRSIGLGGNPPELDDLLAFNSDFFGYSEPEVIDSTLFGEPALRIEAEHDGGVAEIAYMGFHVDQVFLLTFAAPDIAALESASGTIDAVIASIRPLER